MALVSGLQEEESVSRSDPWDSDLRNPGEGEDGSQWASLGRREKSLGKHHNSWNPKAFAYTTVQ